MSEVEQPVKRRKSKHRSNEEILAEMVEQNRKARVRKGQRKRRRSKAQMEADRLAEQKRIQEVAEQKAAIKIPMPNLEVKCVVTVLEDKYWQFGRYYSRGDEIILIPGTPEYKLSFTSSGRFIFDQSPEQQEALWGRVKYEVSPYVVNDSDE